MTPPHNRQRPSRAIEWQRRQLAAWLHEWTIEATLPIDPGDNARPSDDPTLVVPAASACRPARPRLRLRACVPGEVRLVHPAIHDGRGQNPLYVAVIDAAPSDDWWVAPFGRFATPAVPSEWRTGLTAMPLRVLCLWNTRRVPGNRLADCSWRVAALSAARLAAARALLADLSVVNRHAAAAPSVSPGKSHAADMGPPLLHPLDPRWTYLSREADRIQAILAAAGLTRDTAAPGPACAYPPPGDDVLKAAEDKPDFDGNAP